ncbi:nitrate- and nitrite sensing domain-containing protein [Streptosporangium soli]|nr:nitrate- and nitrite sensing domain-containing protein [Streptosporangium sp. KLBMP 9127]
MSKELLHMRNWRVRPRLMALIVLPTAVAVLLTGLQLTTALATAGGYRRMAEVASVVERLATLSHEVAQERDLTAWYIADRHRPARFTLVKKQRVVVDRALARVRDGMIAIGDGHGVRAREEVATVTRWLNGLPGLRKLIVESQVLPRAALGMYTRMITDFATLHDELGKDDERLVADATALGALTRAKEQVARQRGILTVALVEGRFDYDDLTDFLGAWNAQESELATFTAEATPADAERYRTAVSGQQVERADALRALVVARLREGRGIGDLDNLRRDEVRLWFDSATAIVNGMRTVEQGLGDAVVRRTKDLEGTEQRNAMLSGALILIILAVVVLVTLMVAGSLVRPLRRLRGEALQIAGTRLPETVRVLREAGEHAPPVEVPSIGVASRDEIGEVARAFDEVHREAVRLAADEAKLRSNVNAMFVNLSRRSQTLVERQIDLIDDLEQGEQDDGRLASLFRLDHLATRMRRNSENLLVLAGQEQSRRWSDPVPLPDVVRAAVSEVENYERVTVQVAAGSTIVGQSVSDVVHLVAELIENAIYFSPADTEVVVSSNGGDAGGILIAVTDSGIGMNAEELAEANERLATPPAVDLAVARRMGLFVVGRLAMRHGIRVQLRAGEIGGLSAVIMLPGHLVAEAMPSRPSPLQAPMLSASALNDLWAAPIKPADPWPALDNKPAKPEPRSSRRKPTGTPDLWTATEKPADPARPPDPRSSPAAGPADRAGALDPWPSPAAGPADRAGPPDPGSSPTGPAGTGGLWSSATGPAGTGDLWSSPTRRPETADPGPAGTADRWASPVDRAAPPDMGSSPTGPAGPADLWSARDNPVDPWPTAQALPAPRPPGSPWPEGPAQESWSGSALDPEEFLPIFAAVESGWFKGDPTGPTELAPEEPVAAPQDPWNSPGDTGWAAADAAATPAEGGVTVSGLPRRVPKANLVPGTVKPSPAPAGQPPPVRSPERVRSRLSSFQQGVRRGRAEAGETSSAVDRENK